MKTILLLLFTFQLPLLQCQDNSEFEFKSLGIEMGFTGQYPYCIYKDSKGLLWITAENGLFRYDGNKFKIYKKLLKNTNPYHTLFNYQICEDKEGSLWITTQNGISYFNPESETFEEYKSQ